MTVDITGGFCLWLVVVMADDFLSLNISYNKYFYYLCIIKRYVVDGGGVVIVTQRDRARGSYKERIRILKRHPFSQMDAALIFFRIHFY